MKTKLTISVILITLFLGLGSWQYFRKDIVSIHGDAVVRLNGKEITLGQLGDRKWNRSVIIRSFPDSSPILMHKVIDVIHADDVDFEDGKFNGLKPDFSTGVSNHSKEVFMNNQREIIAAAGTLPEMRYVNFLLYQMSKSVPTTVTLQASQPLPTVIDLESEQPVKTDFDHVMQRLHAMSVQGKDVRLKLEGQQYTLTLDLENKPEPKCRISISR